jgi:cell division septation protein DedD
MAEQQQDVETLKRRGRRRLVGAIALVLAAVIVLPMVFDPEPRPVAPPVSVRIPGEDETPFKPKPSASKAQYFVPVGAYANPQSVTAKLDAARLPYYTEAAQGNVTRVRVGPFESREAADQAAGRLRELGLQPGAIAAK